MDFGNESASNLADSLHTIPLWDRKEGEQAEHDGQKMFLTIRSEHSPEYQAAINRQINYNAKEGEKDFDIKEEYVATARLRTAITAECHVFFKGKWITKKTDSTQVEKDKANKQLREFYRELPDMMAMVKTHSKNDMNFLDGNVDDSLIEHDNSPG